MNKKKPEHIFIQKWNLKNFMKIKIKIKKKKKKMKKIKSHKININIIKHLRLLSKNESNT